MGSKLSIQRYLQNPSVVSKLSALIVENWQTGSAKKKGSTLTAVHDHNTTQPITIVVAVATENKPNQFPWRAPSIQVEKQLFQRFCLIAAVSHRFLIPTHNKSFNQYLPAPKRSKIHETTTIGFVSTRRLQYAITCTATAARLDIYLVSIATWGFYMVWEPEGGFDDVAVIGSSMQIEWSRLRGFGTPYRRDISTGSFVLAVALAI